MTLRTCGSLVRVHRLARTALPNVNEAFVYTPAGTLDIRRLEIRWRREDAILVHSGRKGGSGVVTTRIATAIQEMKLRRTNAVRIGEPEGINDRKGAEDG